MLYFYTQCTKKLFFLITIGVFLPALSYIILILDGKFEWSGPGANIGLAVLTLMLLSAGSCLVAFGILLSIYIFALKRLTKDPKKYLGFFGEDSHSGNTKYPDQN